MPDVEIILKEIKFEDGSDVVSKGLLKDLRVSSNKEVTIFLDLDQNYRKIRQLILDRLAQERWITEVDVKLAPKVPAIGLQ